ncbi:hypothetical protein B0H12DRAFT_89335 [Mycena haematopus]|nr:hypothetical protein B0H12DRAFT_89335 [Mycena haematopus]
MKWRDTLGRTRETHGEQRRCRLQARATRSRHHSEYHHPSCRPRPPSGLSRLGELAGPSPYTFDPLFHITKSVRERIVNLNSSCAFVSFHIPWTQSTRERGADVTLTAQDDELCPSQTTGASRSRSEQAPLFAFTDSIVTKDIHFLSYAPSP